MIESNVFECCPKTFLNNICKIYNYSLDATHRGINTCRKDIIKGNNLYTFLHIKNGGNYDGAHRSLKLMEFLYCKNFILNTTNYEYLKALYIKILIRKDV